MDPSDCLHVAFDDVTNFFLLIYIYQLSTLSKEFSAAARVMQSFSNELSTLVSDKV